LEDDAMAELSLGVMLFVSFAVTVAAVIDGWKLKVPNWLTFPFIASGWAYHFWTGGFGALGSSLAGTAVGLLLLLAPYVIGGMGAGDVKLFAGVGAWTGWQVTLGAFCIGAVLGGLIAVAMVVYRGLRAGGWSKVSQHLQRFQMVGTEIMTIRDLDELSARAAARKPTAMLLPYGIPLALGTIGYFLYLGLL
jgi:prepilin peptidase CpaA